MTSAQHAKWDRSGLTWHLAKPLAALMAVLRRYGYTVYDIGNDAHMNHVPPEDHTPYSETGWPGKTPYGLLTAIDVMPGGKGLPSPKAIGDQIDADRSAGLIPWLKYLNKPTNTGNTSAVHVKWQPDRVQTSSSDTGHIHLSARSDSDRDYPAYDPVARIRGGPATPATATTKGPDMIRIGIKGGDGAIYLTTGNGSKLHIGPDLNDALAAGGVPLVWVSAAAYLDAVVNVGADQADSGSTPVTLTQAQMSALNETISEALGSKIDQLLEITDRLTLVNALVEALSHVTLSGTLSST